MAGQNKAIVSLEEPTMASENWSHCRKDTRHIGLIMQNETTHSRHCQGRPDGSSLSKTAPLNGGGFREVDAGGRICTSTLTSGVSRVDGDLHLHMQLSHEFGTMTRS